MKVVLVFPPFYLEPMYNMPPLGLINLATSLAVRDHQPVILDFVLAIRQGRLKTGKNIYQRCADAVLREDPDIVGLSVQCTTFPPAVRIAELIKAKKPDALVVLGGHSASSVDEETLRSFPWIDAVVRGEGEITLGELASAYQNGAGLHGVDGLTFRDGSRIRRNRDRELIPSLDQLPLADYGFLPSLAEYRDSCGTQRSIAILEVGRGCPHNCIYCSQTAMWRRRQRTFSVDRLIAEMRNLHDKFGAECFLLAYDQFTSKRTFVEEFCSNVLEARLNHIPWYCISRLDSVDPPLLDLMKSAGCESMCYGIDSGSKKTLAFIRKNIDQEILSERVLETTDRGIIPTLSFVIGFPEEEKEDIDATLSLALKTGTLGSTNPLIQLATILPGTDLHRRYGDRLIREVDTYFSLGIEFDNGKRLESDEALVDAYPAIFSSFYNLPCPAYSLEELNVIASYFPLIVNFYPRTFLLLGLECKEPPSKLFFRFMNWLRENLDRPHTTLSPQDCYRYFGPFARAALSHVDVPERPYLDDILSYETLALEAARYDLAALPFFIDLNRMSELKPTVNKDFLHGEFAFNIPDIISDIKAGRLFGSYPKQKTHLFFSYESNRLDVKEINDFGVDLMERCDGSATIEDISRELFGRYGQDVSCEKFFDLCVEAVQALVELKLLKPDQADSGTKGRKTAVEGRKI